jgi:hypothetical protein
MALTRVDRERITDSRLKIQSVTDSLTHIDPQNIPEYDEIRGCLQGVERSLGKALRSQDEDPAIL